MNESLTTRGMRRSLGHGFGTLAVLLLLAGALRGVPAAAAPGDPPGPVDLNSAPLEQVLALPVPPEVAEAIVNHRTYLGFFGDVYDLLEVEGMTPALFAAIKPLVSTMPPPAEDASIARLSASYRQVRQYMSQEGSNEGLADEYLDRMRTPENLNTLDLFDLMSYQNVSPVDATNILRARDRLGRFESSRQLRGTDGLRYFAYRNLRDFVVYSDDEVADFNDHALTGYAQTRYTETPMSNDEEELGTFAARTVVPRGRFYVGDVYDFKPGWMNKVRVSGQNGFTAGVLTAREYGEAKWNETVKAFAGVRDRRAGDFRLKSLYVGNFRAAFGLGLVMDNTDYIQYRKTGFGFNKRLLGISGDVSSTYEYHLQGVAFEGSWKRLHLAGFMSTGKKDGIINEDGTINRYVVMKPRPDAMLLIDREVLVNGELVPSRLRRRAIEEDLVGGNMKVMLAPGTFLGVTGYQANYNRGFRPDVATLVTDTGLLEARDREIWESYNSEVANADGSVTEYRWRRVMGAEGQAVIANVAVQGEYAFMQDPHNKFFSTKNPDAMVLNAFAQWDNLHLLAIWRDYDVGFDNPYNRAFSNDNRYEMTLLDAPYRLNDDLYAWLDANTPQPKPEQGLFLETRYRISRQLTLSGLQFDQWTRKADGADMMRYTIKGEYQPVFNLRFRVRHRYSSRSENNPDDVRAFRNWETRWQVIAMLSNYNRLAFTYVTSNVFFPARPRLSGTPGGTGDTAVGTAADPAHAFEARYEHNLTQGIKLTFASSVYDGFFWNFEGDEFVLLDGNGFRNWFKVESRVSERLLFQLKVTRDHNLPNTYVDIRSYGDLAAPTPDATRVTRDDTIVRLQMDYTF